MRGVSRIILENASSDDSFVEVIVDNCAAIENEFIWLPGEWDSLSLEKVFQTLLGFKCIGQAQVIGLVLVECLKLILSSSMEECLRAGA